MTYSGHLIQLPDHYREDQKLKSVINGTYQMPLEHWQTWGMTPSPGRWCLTTLPLEKCLLLSSLNLHDAALLFTSITSIILDALKKKKKNLCFERNKVTHTEKLGLFQILPIYAKFLDASYHLILWCVEQVFQEVSFSLSLFEELLFPWVKWWDQFFKTALWFVY